MSLASISYSHMRFSKKQIVGITAVAATLAYSLRRLRSSSTDEAVEEFAPEQQSPAAD